MTHMPGMDEKKNVATTATRIGFYVLFLLIAAYTMAVVASPRSTPYLTSSEKRWLADANRSFVVGITTIPNQILKREEGGYEGFAVDLYTLLGKELGISFVYRYFDTWHEVIESAKKGEVDVVFLAQKTSERLAFLNFTDTVLSLRNRIIVNAASRFRPTPETLGEATVAVTKGSALAEFLKSHYGGIRLLETVNESEALRKVHERRADATVVEPVRAGYYINRYDLDDLLIADYLGYDYHLSVASRNTMPQLNVILDKAIQNLSDAKLEALRMKWGYIREETRMLDTQTLIYLAIAFGIIIPFAGYLYYTNRKLHYESEARRKAIAQLNVLLAERERLGEILEKRVVEEVEKNRKQELYMLHQNRLAQMGELLNMIAHQWRQPLHTLAIINHILVKKYRKGMLDDKSMEDFERQAMRQISLMSKTIDDFRDFFDPEYKKERFDVNAVVRQTVEVIEPAFMRYGIAIETRLASKPAEIVGYPSGLAQALINIVNNAKDALVEKGAEEKRVGFEVRRTEAGIEIDIEDNADGIAEEIMDVIFDPYFSTKKEKNGTGLGLYMSKKIVEEQLGGKLFVRNTEEGACFTIRIDTREDL